MAVLGKWSGGTITTDNLPETWTTLTTDLFPTEDRNDSSTYAHGAANAFALPASDLADGYLFIGAYEFDDSSNNRFNPQGQIIQTSGTGTFVGGPTGGYLRDDSEDRAYVRAWAFIDNPSASAAFAFQVKADTDDVNAGDGTVRSEFQIIPLYYSDFGAYTSTSTGLYGGTTPNQVTGFTGTDGSNITISSDVISVTGDNKRYLVLGSQFSEGRSGRTQRWHGLDIDGTQEDAAKAYSYYRSTSDDESGDLFTWLIETDTATVTIEQTCYRGDGVLDGEGGADADDNAPTVGDHTLVVLELNDSAEVFLSRDNTQSANLATTGPIDLQINTVTDFNDAASFTDLVDTSINVVQNSDVLFGANISAASGIVSSGSRWTAYAEITVNGTEDSDSFGGDYLRGNQSSIDTFGWSANLLGFQALSAGDDVGVSVTELSGTEGGGGNVYSPAGWSGFWGINLDTMEAGSTSANAEPTGAAIAGQAGTATSEVENPRPVVGPFAVGPHALPIRSYGSFARGAGETAALTTVAGTSAVGTVDNVLLKVATGNESTSGVGAVVGSVVVALTGVLATSDVGSVGYEEDGSDQAIGVEATAEVGSVDNSVTIPLTGVEASGAVGDVAPSAVLTITGNEAAVSVGSVTASNDGSAELSGVEGTSAVGSVGFTESGNVGITGVEGTGAVGSVGVSVGATIPITGVEAASNVGGVDNSTSATLSGNASIGGVGSVDSERTVSLSGEESTSAIGALGFAESGSVGLTGVEATSEVGSVGPETDVSLTGVEGSSAVGSVIAGAPITVPLTGVESTSAVGSIGFTESGNVGLTGVEATGEVGSVTAVSGSSTELSGVEGTSDAGSVTATPSVSLSGVEAASAVGSVTTASGGSAELSGVEADGEVGSVQFTESGAVSLVGVGATSGVGSVGFTKSGIVALTGVEATSAVGSAIGAETTEGEFYADEQVIISRTETEAPLWIGVDSSGGVAGLTVTVQVRDGATINSYLDFNDDTFKTSGWVQKSLTLTDIGGGHYTDTLDVSAITNLPSNNHLALEYDISGSVVGIARGTLSFDQAAPEVFGNLMENGETFAEQTRLIRADAAGKIVQAGDGSYAIRDAADSKDRIEGDDAANGGRDISATDGA